MVLPSLFFKIQLPFYRGQHLHDTPVTMSRVMVFSVHVFKITSNIRN